eukprot:CAMPEP_0168559548 /NCGR_PEP_ID=MMETSP0413-20121227/10585_1 /TAXON_ID=136452 /ORGANISM="Filamoeba nolandi, Strain NC-AS-23-1" /LENGTH=199 /DNA_ID=CAMNT_0008590789 /DNA_START=202 /DNA_END=798 /DNA_ORIENTATION=-
MIHASVRVAIFYYIKWQIKCDERVRPYWSHKVPTTIFGLLYDLNNGSSMEINLALIGVFIFSILLPIRLDGIQFPWTVALALPCFIVIIPMLIYRWLKSYQFSKSEAVVITVAALYVQLVLLLIGLKLDGVINASWWLVNIPIFSLTLLLPALFVAPFIKDNLTYGIVVFFVSLLWISPVMLFHLFTVMKITGAWNTQW